MNLLDQQGGESKHTNKVIRGFYNKAVFQPASQHQKRFLATLSENMEEVNKSRYKQIGNWKLVASSVKGFVDFYVRIFGSTMIPFTYSS